jgi:ParB family chromosome partitioning protein
MGSQKAIGLLHPIVVTPSYTLIVGDRRLRAIKKLGRKTIDATVVDIDKIAHGEYAENMDRKDFTWAEAVAILKEVRPRGGGGQAAAAGKSGPGQKGWANCPTF